jgi:hypothetical protein
MRRQHDEQWHLADLRGRYWISPRTSVRSTTAPGVAARLRPTSNDDVSAISGIGPPPQLAQQEGHEARVIGASGGWWP